MADVRTTRYSHDGSAFGEASFSILYEGEKQRKKKQRKTNRKSHEK
jgi:hypothetical protein